MSQEEITAKVGKIIAEVLGLPESSVGADFTQKANQNWDSLNHLKLVMELEKQFNISFNTEEVFSMDTVKEICYVVKKHLQT